MPKETFFNLPTEKNQKLIDALKKEFSNTSLTDASIANIINYAQIPRGSFYQYFENKEDAFFYLFDKQINYAMEQFILILQKHDGNIFDTTITFYQLIIEERENFTFFKNALLNMNYKIEESLIGIFASTDKMEHFKNICQQINWSLLTIQSEEDFFQLMKIIAAVTFHNFVEKFSKDLPIDVSIYRYKTQLSLIRNGIGR
ncbi:TetR/AcrR family transcriptional regulator [Gracilibacillus massiliensis]|uniref:TetR/AcrR family transcriptional regulator n=1 Tax=Gracilibacillus massiliensis TaxID=1564956 RepID=UPI00071E4CA0|nr:TetR/AcrR family transcriptional regulator [Gracilibacillus massiliensis]